MPESTAPMPDERLAEIRFSLIGGNLTHADVDELLAEVERLRDVERRRKERLEREATWQRELYRRRHPDAQPKPEEPQPCGTPAAYQRHHRNAEDVCEACAKAWSDYQAAYRAKRKAVTNAS